ncbi:MAG: pyruvate kinase [Acidobacteria bacterium]|nr:MAG: pyruvate kinase [Acidobacteriota bacterium]
MAKIVATLGPASEGSEILSNLVLTGVDVFRLNLSHGTREEHRRRIRLVRRLAARHSRQIGILVDLPGPKIRTGNLVGHLPVTLPAGSRVTLTTRSILGRPGLISTGYRHLPRDVRKGSRVLLDDGNMELEVLRVAGTEILCRVVVGGTLSEHKGINLPGTPVAASSPTSKDRQDLEFAVREQADWIALSFVKRPQDLIRARRAMSRGRQLPLVAKIERREGVEALEGILSQADGVMVARGDLAVEISPEEVPVLQKKMIRGANLSGVIVITATQMLESMMESPRPTRAEASDVANAVFDGSDAVMLSGETASGNFPVESVRMMDAIIRQAEASGLGRGPEGEGGCCAPDEDLHAVVHAASQAALDARARAVAVYTQTGRTARFLSKLRPPCPFIALTFDRAVARQMALYWGVTPVLIHFASDTDTMLAGGEKEMLRHGLISRGDRIVVVAGSTSFPGGTNMMKIHGVGAPGRIRRRIS